MISMRILLDSKIFEEKHNDCVISDNLKELRRILEDAGIQLDPRTLSIEVLIDIADSYDFIITENRDIHKVSNELDIIDKILLVDEALQIFRGYLTRDTITAPPALKSVLVGNLDYYDPIFDSLKEEYDPEFESWFKKISDEGRNSWVYYRTDESIGALLIYKFEDESIDNSKPSLPKKKRLKIATLKVTHIGYKIGELFIKMAIDISVRNGINEIYLTHFTKSHDRLVELISEYGFNKIAIKDDGQDIFVKRLTAKGYEKQNDHSPIEISRIFYPSFYDGNDVKKFIVPILPVYHNKLFTDFPKRQTTLLEHSGDFIVEGNTIKKAYISHSNIKIIGPGDLILFYRSEDLQAITSIGVVESIYTGISDAESVLRLAGKRTVFSKQEIDKLVQEGPVSVFLFRHHIHLSKPLGLMELLDGSILKGAPQSAMKLIHEKYIKIKEIGDIDGRFTIH
ncbi:MAG TPA: hypothetical protein VMY43_06895 [Methanothrix sp.]|nr:hypothetical protein [Methanothrix sp.]